MAGCWESRLHLGEGAALPKPCQDVIFERGSSLAGRNVNTMCPVSRSTSHTLAHLVLTTSL